MILPTSVEPVKATLSTSGWRTSRSPAVSPMPVTMLTTPAGNAGLGDQVGEAQRGQRRLLGGLEHERAAGGERRRDLLHRHHQREVPRHDLGADADRLAPDISVERCRSGTPEGSIMLAAELGRPAGHVAQRRRSQPGMSSRAGDRLRLAVVDRFELGELVGMLASIRSASLLDHAARARSGGRPVQRPSSNAVRAAATARSTSASDASTIRRDLLAGRGIVDGDRRAVARVDPFAVDEQLRLARSSACDRLANKRAGRRCGSSRSWRSLLVRPPIARGGRIRRDASRLLDQRLRRSSARGGTARPRWTAGRAAIASSQRWRWSSPSIGDARPFVDPRPAEIGDVGDRIVAGEIFMVRRAGRRAPRTAAGSRAGSGRSPPGSPRGNSG